MKEKTTNEIDDDKVQVVGALNGFFFRIGDELSKNTNGRKQFPIASNRNHFSLQITLKS